MHRRDVAPREKKNNTAQVVESINLFITVEKPSKTPVSAKKRPKMDGNFFCHRGENLRDLESVGGYRVVYTNLAELVKSFKVKDLCQEEEQSFFLAQKLTFHFSNTCFTIFGR